MQPRADDALHSPRREALDKSANALGQWVREARRAVDLTQEALAAHAGCAVQTIRKIEAGERRPSQQMAERLAQVLELPPDERAAFLSAVRGSGPQVSAPASGRTSQLVPSPSHALPTFQTRFTGRQAELAEVRRLLVDPDYRLVTLVGPGGIGKTRVAVEAARDCPPFADGVAFVPLAPISAAALLVPTIAHAIGFTFSGPEPPAVQLFRHLATKELLLILDNLEHLLGETPDSHSSESGALPGTAADLLAGILDQTRRVKLLVTSRERVNLRGEWVVQLGGLPIWQAEVPGSSPDADAVVLFAERARQVQHDFQLTIDNRHLVTRICSLLEGMPLGIELAATWARVLSCAEIVAELERGLDFLQVTTHDLPERHRSMRAVFEHSWQLLDADEQQVLRRLAVFRGGFTRLAAEQVAGATLALLAAVVDKSLVRRVSVDRYDLHEVVRQYAAAHLDLDQREQAATRDRHCAYFVGWLAKRDPLLKSARQGETVVELTTEIDNVRTAWDWAARRRRLADLRKAIPTLFYFYEIRSRYQEAATLFQQAADALDAAPAVPRQMPGGPGEDVPMLVGELLAMQAWFVFRYAQYGRAKELLQQSQTLLGHERAMTVLSDAVPYPPWLLRYRLGDYSGGAQLLRARFEGQRERGDKWGMAFSLLHLGLLLRYQGDDEEACCLMREAVVLSRATGDPVAMARILSFAAIAVHAVGAHGEAQQLAGESLAIGRDIDDRFSIATALHARGLVAHTQGAYVEARAALEESLAIFTSLGYRWNMAHGLTNLGQTLHALGAPGKAYRTLLEALEVATEVRTIRDGLDATAELATLMVEQGKAEQALEAALHVLHHPAGSQRAKDRIEPLRRELEATLAPHAVVAIRARVQARSFEEAVAELLARFRAEEMQRPASGSEPA